MAAVILYFSRGEENYVSGAIRYLAKGNTEIAAELIRTCTGADSFRIEPVTAYSEDYSTCVEQAKNDQKRDARPALAAYPVGMERYDTIYLGYPNYWGTMPMPVFTLLEAFSFAGKAIWPFCTHEGGGLGRSIQDIRRLCPGADVKPGLALQGGQIKHAEGAIRAWLARGRKKENEP
ncbi:MAG: flavodoxin [Ruthenibacterium sp.]